jgi:hypothetical protein
MQGASAPSTFPTGWQFAAASATTLTIIGIGTENGITYIDIKWQGTSTTGASSGFDFTLNTDVPANTGQVWALSSYLKIVGGSLSGINAIRLELEERTAVGFVTNKQSAALTIPTTGNLALLRRSFAAILNGGATVAYVKPRIRLVPAGAGSVVDITLRVGLPQLEQASFATSVIKTTSAAVTRNADVATMTGTNFSDWFNAPKGTFRVDFKSIISGNRPVIAVDDNTANEALIIKTQGNAPTFEVVDGGSPQASVVAGTVAANIAAFAYVSYDVNFFGIARPTARQVDTIGTVPTVDRMRIGSDQAGNFFSSLIQKIQFWD